MADPNVYSDSPLASGFAPDYDPAYAASNDPNAAYAKPYAAGYNPALASRAAGALDSPYASDQAAFAQQLRGAGDPNEQLSALQQQRQSAADQKVASIQRAIAILQAARGGQTTNLPLLAAAGAMLKPTRSGGFAESLGNSFEAAAPYVQQDRQRDLGLAGAYGRLGTEEADVPLQVSQQDVSDFQNRMRLAEQAGSSAAISGTRLAAAGLRADTSTANTEANNASRESIAAGNQATRYTVAELANTARIDAATIRANAGQWHYIGPSADDPTVGVWSGPGGEIRHGEAVNRVPQKGDSASAPEVARLVQAETNRLANGQANGLPAGPGGKKLNDQELQAQATANVMKRLQGGGYTPPKLSGQAAPLASAPPAPAQRPAPQPSAPSAPSAQPPQQQGRQATPDQVAAARAAIQNGAPREAVLQRFRDNGVIPPDGL